MIRLCIIVAFLLPGFAWAQPTLRWNRFIEQVEDRKFYPKHKTPADITIYTYHQLPNRIRKIYCVNGSVVYEKKGDFYFNDDGRLDSVINYEDDTLESTTTYYYNTGGKVVRAHKVTRGTRCNCGSDCDIFFDTLGNFTGSNCMDSSEHFFYRYDTCGTEITKYQYAGAHFLALKRITTYNSKLDVVREVNYKPSFNPMEMDTNVTDYTYVYDAKGNWIKKSMSVNGFFQYRVERTITYIKSATTP